MLTKSTHYRPDIDGLRAIAVLAVILFHINKHLVPGGFVGVDVFFVISGYLITGNITKKIYQGNFSISEFYGARVKRIAPALMTVIATVLIVGQILLLPDDSASLAKSAFWSVASMANVYFWIFQDTSYFAISSEQLPLLHLWSLGVEEQFYILWPLALIFANRKRQRAHFYTLCAFVTAGSFIFGSVYFQSSPLFTYYMLPSRVGELLIGGIAAFLVKANIHNRVAAKFISPIATAGLILIIFSMACFSERVVFPGLLSLAPTIGAAAVIFSGNCGSSWLTRFLSSKILLWFGSLSYSLYLWHWPILAFYRYGYGAVGPFSGIAIFILTATLAWLTYRYIEKPARYVQWSLPKIFGYQFFLPACLLLAFSLGGIYLDRIMPSRLDSAYRQAVKNSLDRSRPAYAYKYVCQRQRLTSIDTSNVDCLLGRGSGVDGDVILWGDSNAAHYIGVIGSFANRSNFRFRNIEVGDCPPIFDDVTDFARPDRLSDCNASLPIARKAIDNARVLIISASWSQYQYRSEKFLESFYSTVRRITERGTRVIVIGKAPTITGFDRGCDIKELRYPFLDCGKKTSSLPASTIHVNGELKKFAQHTTNVSYFEVNEFLCPQAVCFAYGDDGIPFYYDEGHLSMTGSWRVGELIIQQAGVPAEFRSISAEVSVQGSASAKAQEDFSRPPNS